MVLSMICNVLSMYVEALFFVIDRRVPIPLCRSFPPPLLQTLMLFIFCSSMLLLSESLLKAPVVRHVKRSHFFHGYSNRIILTHILEYAIAHYYRSIDCAVHTCSELPWSSESCGWCYGG